MKQFVGHLAETSLPKKAAALSGAVGMLVFAASACGSRPGHPARPAESITTPVPVTPNTEPATAVPAMTTTTISPEKQSEDLVLSVQNRQPGPVTVYKYDVVFQDGVAVQTAPEANAPTIKPAGSVLMRNPQIMGNYLVCNTGATQPGAVKAWFIQFQGEGYANQNTANMQQRDSNNPAPAQPFAFSAANEITKTIVRQSNDYNYDAAGSPVADCVEQNTAIVPAPSTTSNLAMTNN